MYVFLYEKVGSDSMLGGKIVQYTHTRNYEGAANLGLCVSITAHKLIEWKNN